MQRVLVVVLLSIVATGCATAERKRMLRVSVPEPLPAATATRMSPALDCLGEAFVHDPPQTEMNVWVCPFAATSGLSPEAGWQYTMDALLRVAHPGGPITIRDCRPEWTPTPIDPKTAFIGGMSISGRAVLENGVLAKYADFGVGWSTAGRNILGIGAESELSRMAVSMYLRNGDRTLFQHPISTAALFESNAETNVDATLAIVEGAGISAGAGLLEVASREQILRHLIDVAVFSMLVRYFDAGSECIDASRNWDTYRDEFLALDASEQARVKAQLRTRLGGAGKVPETLPSYDGSLTLDEYVWARAARFLGNAGAGEAATAVALPSRAAAAAPVVARVPPPADPVVVADAPVAASAPALRDDSDPARGVSSKSSREPSREAGPSQSDADDGHGGGIYLVNRRLVSAADGYVECFATDSGSGSRVQRLDVAGATLEGRILKSRAYPVAAPSDPGLDRTTCFRTPASLYEFLPTSVRSGAPVVMLFRDIAAVFAQRGWKLASVEAPRS